MSDDAATIPPKPISADELLASVPEPVLPGRPDLLAMYRRCWEIALAKSERGTPENGFVDWYIDAAYDRRIFQWDTSFSCAWAKYAHGALPGVISQDNFYRKQHPDGHIHGVIRKEDGRDDEPPECPWSTRNNLFSWAEWEHYQVTGDASRFERVVPILSKYADWVARHRRHPDGHYFWSGWSSGMDNSPRSRVQEFYPPHAWVDYDANEALAAWHLARMAEVIGDEQTARACRARHAELKDLVNRDMWSPADRFYWDLDRDGSHLKVKTVASFWPMWGRITEAEHVAGLVHHLNDAGSFNRPHRVPSCAADEGRYVPTGGYWRGAVWAPTNHMIVRGLVANGQHKLARDIVLNHLNHVAAVFGATGTVYENYAPEFTKPGAPALADFVGWSAVGPVAELIENYIGLEISVPDARIDWHLLTFEEVGLRNLKFGGGTIELLVARERRKPEEPIRIDVKTDRTFTLCVHDARAAHERRVEPGSHELSFGQPRQP